MLRAMTELHLVDVFAEQRLAGNQLAVVLSDRLPDALMQALALEMGFSETTFVGARADDGAWPVRIFTPRTELPFAGHPTLGSAAVIRAQRDPGAEKLVLRLGAGDVPVAFDADGVAWMEPPAPRLGAQHAREPVARLLSLDPAELDPAFPVQQVTAGIAFTLVPLRSLEAARRVRYRLDLADELAAHGIVSDVFLFTRETEDPACHVHARMLAPAHGVPEDPATGSANTCFAGYVVAHRYLPAEIDEIRVEQGLEIGRPSLLRLRPRPTLRVGGRVLAVARGELLGLDDTRPR
jgi:trans-2,3-dihydro-3-hydroxyanthranilate isomerase